MMRQLQLRQNNNPPDFLFWLLVITMLILMMCGCSTHRVVQKEVVRVDTIYKVSHDTLRIAEYHTSVDTFWQEHTYTIYLDNNNNVVKEKESHNTYRSKERNDSSDYYKAIIDSLKHVKKEKEKEVIEKKPSFLEKIKDEISSYIIVFLLMLLICLYVKKWFGK